MSLSELTVELVLLIPPFLSKKDGSHLSQTCKRLRRITLPHVYKTIKWEWKPADDRRNDSFPIHLLLRSFMKRPELGSLVEHVDFRENKNHLETTRTLWTAQDGPKLTEKELKEALGWAEGFSVASSSQRSRPLGRGIYNLFPTTAPEVWSQAIKRGDVDAYIALMLAFTSELCVLTLSHELVANSRFIGSLLKQALHPDPGEPSPKTLPQYSHLRSVKCSAMNESEAPMHTLSRFKDMYSAFYLPSLETLSIELGRLAQFRMPGASQRPRLACLSSLELPHCQATEDALEQILSAKPPLKNLHYTYACAEDISYCKAYLFDLDILSRALSYVHTTLETLKLGIDFLSDVDELDIYSDGCLRGSLDSFRHFTCLSNIHIPFLMLAGWPPAPRKHTRRLSSQLPSSMRELCLADDLADWRSYREKPGAWLEYVKDLFSDREASQGEIIPNLQQVDLDLHTTMRRWKEEDEVEFGSICERCGVQGLLNRKLHRHSAFN